MSASEATASKKTVRGKRKPHAAAKKPAIRRVVPVTDDAHLRSAKRNAEALSASIEAADRGELVAFDPRRK